jgi:hypothetical protein
MFEPPALVAGLDDVAVVGQPVEQGGRHLRITEHRRPLAERQVGGDDHAGPFVELADEVEEELAARTGERRVAQLIEYHEIEPGELLGQVTCPKADAPQDTCVTFNPPAPGATLNTVPKCTRVGLTLRGSPTRFS